MSDRLRIEYLPLTDLVGYARNPKDHDLGALSASIDRFGFLEPILVDEASKTIVAGHGRVDALSIKMIDGDEPPEHIALNRGAWLVPVIYGASFLDPHEMSAYVIASNRIGELGGWHEELLLAELQVLAEQEIPLEGIGYDLDDLDTMIADANFAAKMAEPLPAAPEVAPEPQKRDETFGIIVQVADKDTEDAVLSLLEMNGYPAMRVSDPTGRKHAGRRKNESPRGTAEES